MANSTKPFLDHLKNAWLDTFAPNRNAEETEPNFVHDFLGWPKKDKTSKKVGYFVGLVFLFRPLVSTLKVLTELLPNVLAETFDYLTEQLVYREHSSDLTKYLSYGLAFFPFTLQAFFTGISWLLRPITSPFETA